MILLRLVDLNDLKITCLNSNSGGFSLVLIVSRRISYMLYMGIMLLLISYGVDLIGINLLLLDGKRYLSQAKGLMTPMIIL